MTQTSLLGNVQRLIEITELWELKKETQNIKNITNIFDIFGQTKTQNFVKNLFNTSIKREHYCKFFQVPFSQTSVFQPLLAHGTL